MLSLNTPSKKPELWAHPLFSLQRRLRYSVRRVSGREGLAAPVQFQIKECELSIESSLDDYIGKSLFLYGVWELHETTFMKRFLRRGMTVVDVGANIGYHSLIACRLVGETGTVLALEPSDRTRALFQRNLELNGATNVTVESLAAADFEGEVSFFESESAQFHVLSSTIQSPLLSPEHKQVGATTLDTLLSRHNLERVDLIKVDVEGGELGVFRGAAGILQAPEPPLLMFEAHGELIRPISEFLAEHGFAIASLTYRPRSTRLLKRFDTSSPVVKGEVDYVGYQEWHQPRLAGMF